MRRVFGVLVLSLLAAGCAQRDPDSQAMYDKEGRVKPVVALVPLIDRTKSDLPWNLSDELTSAIYNRLALKNKMRLIDSRKMQSSIKKLNAHQNPFSDELGWVKNIFNEEEFIVFLELVEHEEIPVSSQTPSDPQNLPAELNISVRVRVLDLRSEQPKVVLQELIHESHYIPMQFNRYNFYQIAWDKDGFSISPIGLAHAQMIKEISARLEDYILWSAPHASRS